MKRTAINRKPKAKSLGWWRGKCDELMQQIGKAKNPRSIISGQPTEVMHHFVPKSVSSMLRYNWDNLIPLTNGEHNRLHQSGDPEYEQAIARLKGGDAWYLPLRKLGREINQVSVGYYKRTYQQLAEEAEAYGIPTPHLELSTH